MPANNDLRAGVEDSPSSQTTSSPSMSPPSMRSPPSWTATPASGLPVTALTFAAAVTRELGRVLSEMNASAIVSQCATAAGVRREQLGPSHLPAILAQVQASFDLFGVSEERRARCLSQLRALVSSAREGPSEEEQVTVTVEREADIVRARNAGKSLCAKLGFTDVGTTKVATAISELARNIVKYAQKGTIVVRRVVGGRGGVEVVASDRGPGIADVEAVLRPGYRSRTGMGMGLRGTRALMDFFEIRSRPGDGTIVFIRKLPS